MKTIFFIYAVLYLLGQKIGHTTEIISKLLIPAISKAEKIAPPENPERNYYWKTESKKEAEADSTSNRKSNGDLPVVKE